MSNEFPEKPKYAKGSFPAMLGNTRIIDVTKPGRATVFMSSPANQPADEPKPSRTPEQEQFLRDMERVEGRKLTVQEENLHIDQSESLGFL